MLLNRLDRYILKIAAGAAVVLLLGLTGVIWVTQALREVDGGDAISVVGHDDLPIGSFTSPALSSMRMTGGNLGRSFASLLLRSIAGEPAQTLQELHAIEFVDRDSHRRPLPAA